MSNKTSFQKALEIVFKLEFSTPSNALHTNPGEIGFTFCGIYQHAHPNWSGWVTVEESFKRLKDIKKASVECYNNPELMKKVEEFYNINFWTKYSLDKLNETAASEIFVFGINTGMHTAIKKAQKVAGTLQDGKIGPATIKAINIIPESVFDLKFDEEEISYYNSLISKKPSFKVFEKGWHNRANLV